MATKQLGRESAEDDWGSDSDDDEPSTLQELFARAFLVALGKVRLPTV